METPEKVHSGINSGRMEKPRWWNYTPKSRKNKDKINPDTTGQPAHKRAKIPRSNERTIEDTQLYTYSLSDVRKAAEEEIRQMKKKRSRLQNDAQMTQDPNTNSHIRIEIT